MNRTDEPVIRPHCRTQEFGLTVGQLRAALADVPDEFEVVMAADAEGNSYSPLADVSVRLYLPETTWSGEMYPPDSQVDADERGQLWPEGVAEQDRAPEGAYLVIELGPTN